MVPVTEAVGICMQMSGPDPRDSSLECLFAAPAIEGLELTCWTDLGEFQKREEIFQQASSLHLLCASITDNVVLRD